MIEKTATLTYCVLTALLAFTDAANILGVFPINARSHYNFNGAIMRSLADAGHSVTVITPFAPKRPYKNMKIIDPRADKSETNVRFANRDFKKMSWLEYVRMFTETMEIDCYNVAQNEEIRTLLASKDVKFDVMFVQMLPMYECYLPVAQIFQAPVVGTFSFHEYANVDQMVGNPHPWTLPFTFCYAPKMMTFYERLKNAYCHLRMKLFYEYEVVAGLRTFYERHYPSYDFRTDGQISSLFVNNHASFFSRPAVPTLVEIGGIHIDAKRPLSERIRKFIDESEHDVILFSVGTISGGKVIDAGLRQIFRDVFAELPQRVIWKFNEPVANLSTNVLMVDWMSQVDILADEKVKLFISHCGIGGTFESIYAAKPLVLMPINFDQPSNAALLHELEVGIFVDIKTITKDSLLNAIRRVLQEEKYTKNVQRLSQQFRDRPMSPKESVVYWTEYVVRYNGTEHLDVASKNMPLHQYLLLDVILFVASIALSIILVVRCTLKKLSSLSTRSTKLDACHGEKKTK